MTESSGLYTLYLVLNLGSSEPPTSYLGAWQAYIVGLRLLSGWKNQALHSNFQYLAPLY